MLLAQCVVMQYEIYEFVYKYIFSGARLVYLELFITCTLYVIGIEQLWINVENKFITISRNKHEQRQSNDDQPIHGYAGLMSYTTPRGKSP